jgi:endoglucanase
VTATEGWVLRGPHQWGHYAGEPLMMTTRISKALNLLARLLACSLVLPAVYLAPGCKGGAQRNPSQTPVATVALPLHTSGQFIVDANGERVRLKAFNWYGAESPDAVVGGLAYQSLDTIVGELHAWGFNAVRLLWSNQNVEANPIINSQAVAANPDFVGMHALDAFDRIVATLAANHFLVILDNHVSDAIWCCSDTDGDGLWATAKFPESRWISDWQMMARRYANQPNVVGADLRNELRCVPGGSCATWGGDSSTDWHAAAERGGNAVLASNPNLLIFVEGPSYDTDLSGAATLPVTLSSPGHVVYEAHDYGFDYSSNPLSGYSDWVARINPRWGYLATGANPQPLWLGEFGTCNTTETCVASSNNTDLGFWFQIMTQFVETNRLDWCYWPVNGTYSNYPNAGKTYGNVESYGILNTAWNEPSRASLLSTLQQIMQ